MLAPCAAASLLGGIGLCLASADRAEKLSPPELVEFAPYEHNPIFTARGEGRWDKRIRQRGWILLEDGAGASG